MKKTTLSLAILPFFLLLTGCGTADYESQLNKAATVGTSKFDTALGPETTIPDTSISLRLPKVMKLTDVNDAIHGKCPILDLPGLKASYEGSVGNDPNNKWHYYLYVCAREVPANNNTSPSRSLLNDLTKPFPNAADSSSEVNKNFSVETPQGTSLEWEEFHYKFEQKFFYPKADNPQNQLNTQGGLIYLCRQEGNMHVILVYRYPEALADRHSTDFDSDWIRLVAGTLKAGAAGG